MVLIAIGSFMIYWSINHSPNAPIESQFADIFDEKCLQNE